LAIFVLQQSVIYTVKHLSQAYIQYTELVAPRQGHRMHDYLAALRDTQCVAPPHYGTHYFRRREVQIGGLGLGLIRGSTQVR
jgi:hypothetical protein